MKFRKSRVLLLVLLLILTLVGCSNTSYDNSENIIEAEALKDIYKNEDVVVIDARGQEAYDAGHVVGAICLAPADLVVDKPVASTVAPQAKVERVLGDAGISNATKVYIYDDNSGVSASRIWWTMKLYGHNDVKVVNGGFNALAEAKFEGTKNATVLEPVTYTASEADASMIADFELVKSITEDPDSKVKIVDVRSVAEYDQGNIPGAILYPHTNNLYKDGTFMSSRDITLFYMEKDIKKEDTLILYCKSSFRATQTMLLLREAGFENVKVYDGAWLEWEANGGASDTPATDAPITKQDGS
ncbi:MAG: sulfurtransferase [Clostridia bacterium]|nr:sulfurtransferase [Clostridia bacterium]